MAERTPEEITLSVPEGFRVARIILEREDEEVEVEKPEDLSFTPFQLDPENSLLSRFSRITAEHSAAIIGLPSTTADRGSYSTEQKSPFDDCEAALRVDIEALSKVPPKDLFRRTVNVLTSPLGPSLSSDVAEGIANKYLAELARIYESSKSS